MYQYEDTKITLKQQRKTDESGKYQHWQNMDKQNHNKNYETEIGKTKTP